MSQVKNGKRFGKQSNTIQSLERALMILEYLRKGPTSLSEISRELGIHKSTIFGLLQTLMKYNYVQQEERTKHYMLSYQVLELSGAFLENCDIRKIAAPYLQDLVEEHNETVHLVILDNDGYVVYVDKIESLQPIRMVSRIGSRLPAHCTGVGKAILAYIPEEKAKLIFEKSGSHIYTPNTITTWDKLNLELAQIREEGVAYDMEEIELGLRCVAAPIIGYGQYPLGAFSVSGPATRMTMEKISTVAKSLRDVSRKISRQMGQTIGFNGFDDHYK